MHHTHNLENGLKIIFIPNKNSKICRINMHIDAGSIYESETFPIGTSHFVEHMLFNGTEKYPMRKDLLNLIYKNGGVRGALTSHFEQRHFITISKKNIEGAIEYLSQTLLHPNLTKESFQNERSIILNELLEKESSLDRIFYTKGVNKTIFKTKALRNYPLGNEYSIKLITHENIQDFYSKFFTTNRMTLFISGDYNKNIINKLCEKYFDTKKHLDKLPTYKLNLNCPKDTILTYKGIKGVKISCALFLKNINYSEYLSFLFLIQILCVGTQSRLFKELREKRNLIYSIHPNNMCLPDGLLIGIVTQSSSHNIDLIKNLILEEIKKISINSIGIKDLIRVKKIYLHSILEQNDSTIGLSDSYFKHFRKFRTLYDSELEKDKIDMITTVNIKKSAEKILQKELSWIQMI